ncbi:MAG: outer membrane beta-barrel protein [Polyangiaceae bacterium]
MLRTTRWFTVAATLLGTSSMAHAQSNASDPHAAEPFAFGDFTWLNGNSRQHKAIFDTPYFTPEFLIDVNYTASINNPIDHTVVGSTALSRSNELTLAFLGFGGDFHYEHVRARLMTQFGVRSTLVPRNDFSTNRGQFDLQTAMRYISEAYGGYHFDVLNGMNVDAGIFMSYVGLFSYDNFENWMYLPSFTSDNTPWFFNGIRTQIYTSDKLKIEPWLINGWQSYGKFNELPGFGGQILYRPIRVALDPLERLRRVGHAGQPVSRALPQRQQRSGSLLQRSQRQDLPSSSLLAHG